jgi:hypothetical protein
MTIVIIIGVIAGIIIGFHTGSGHAHYRHQKAGCARTSRRRPSLWAALGRGAFVWLSVPVGGGFRLGHRLP